MTISSPSRGLCQAKGRSHTEVECEYVFWDVGDTWVVEDDGRWCGENLSMRIVLCEKPITLASRQVSSLT